MYRIFRNSGKAINLAVVFSMLLSIVSPILIAEAKSPSGIEATIIDELDDFAYGTDPDVYTEEHQVVPLLSDELALNAQPAKERPVGLELSANPAILFPDKPVRLKWSIRSWNQVSYQAEVKLVIRVPDNLVPQDAALATQVDTDGVLEIEVTKITGTIVWDVVGNVSESFEIIVDLYIDDEWIDMNAVLLKESPHLVDHQTGGQVNAFGGRVKVEVPAAAIAQSLVFDVRSPGLNTSPPVSLTGRPIEVLAANPVTGNTVTQFSEPITIQMSYEEDQIWNWAEEDLKLFYYDEATRDWYPLETEVDVENKLLRAQTDHLTVFDYKASTWQAASLPSVDAFQVSNFTGAATYGLSFWTPPGTAGLQPSISLNYNSQVIDNSTAFTQASWVGMGWSLETGSINRNMHETNSDTSDDTFSISSGGVSGLLLPISVSGTVTAYETSNMSYSRIEFDSSVDQWTVWDRGGMKYEFDHTTKTNKTSGCSTTLDITWQWSLTKVTDVHGNELIYTYENEIKTGASCSNEIAVYPATITYPNGLYRIRFVTEARTDYQTSWVDAASRVLYGTKRLKEILVEHDANGDSNWATMRKYQFGYSPDINNQIYPSFVWIAGGMTQTLVGVQEVSGDGLATLPAVTFSYADDMHLTTADNGQGGSVSMEYERWTYFDDINDDLRSLYTEFGYEECNPYGFWGTYWYEVYTSTGKVRCDPSSNKLQVGEDPNYADAHRSIPQHIVKPGGRYRFYVRLRAQQGSTDINWGFIDTDTNDNQMSYSDFLGWYISTSYSEWETGFEMPVDYDPLATKLMLECNDCLMAKVQFILQPLVFRVTEKSIADAVTGETATYTYQYDNPTPNTEASSQDIVDAGGNYSADELYAYPFREFRGHALSQVVNSENLANLTWFYQTDQLKGTSYRTMTLERSVWDDLESKTAWTESGGTHTSTYIYEDDFENSIKSVNGSANWNVSFKRTSYTLSNGEVAIAQIRLEGASTQGEVGLETAAGQFFGIRLDPITSGAYPVYDTGSGLLTGSALISAANLDTDKWYTVMFFVDDDDGFVARIWQMDDPQNQGEFSQTGFSASQSWRFSEKAYNGTVWLDAYIEGIPYSETETKYTSYESESNILGYPDLDVFWNYPTETITRSYEGDAEWVGTKTTYEYNVADQNGVQYGNLTRAVVSEWNGSSWDAHVGSQTFYYPTAGTAYLVSLPARSITVDCTTGCDFDGTPTKLSDTIFIYDSNSSYSTAPTTGKLASQRVLMDTDGVDKYSVVSYGYDDFGNVDTVTSYRDYGSISGTPGGISLPTTTVYESTYDTYPVKVINSNDQAVWTTYDYNLGVPTSVTPLYPKDDSIPSSGLTTATYDDFGRMKTVIAPEDGVGAETLKIEYFDYTSNTNPFHVLLTQKINETDSMQAIRYYSGTGQMLQTQSLGVEVADGGNGSVVLQNIVVDNDFDTLGRLVRQTVPYGVASGSYSFQTQTFAQDLTTSVYDVLGRATSVTAPNGNVVSTSFADLQVTSTDPKLEQTVTNFDIWGNVTSVSPPSGPGLAYDYDLLGRLETVIKGSAPNETITTIIYDFGGRKLSMADPDMGSWSYEYDALGSLVAQTDARGCVIDLGYDGLNRLETKIYTVTGTCESTPDVTYYYDGDAFAFDGVPYGDAPNSLGQRTGMVDGSGATSWTYDIRGRMTDETKVIIETVSPLSTKTFDTSWGYNSADMVTSMTYPDLEVVNYGYNAQGALESMEDASAAFIYVDNVTYDLTGRMRYLGLGNGGSGAIIDRSYSYYAWDTPTKGGLLQSLVSNGAIQLQNLSYNYDANGNVSAIIDSEDSETSTFSYDDLNRLTSMTVVGGIGHSEVFNYNPNTGSVASTGVDQQPVNLLTFSYDDASHPHAVSGYDGNSYTYDANGNQIERSLEDGTYTLVYDAENRLVQVDNLPSVVPQSFYYPEESQSTFDLQKAEYDPMTIQWGHVNQKLVQLPVNAPPNGPLNSPSASPIYSPLYLSESYYGLKAYWDLDETSGTRVDSHRANDLADTNSVGYVTGILSNAADFDDSSSQYLSIADNEALSAGDEDFTIACWVYLPATKDAVFLSKGIDDSGYINEYALRYDKTEKAYAFEVSSDGSATTSVIADTFGTAVKNEWTYVVVWHDSVNDTLNIQVNDGAVDNISYSVGVYDGAGNFVLGYDGQSTYLNGGVDEVGFWKRTLSATERTDLYNSGAGLAYPFGWTPPPDPIFADSFTSGDSSAWDAESTDSGDLAVVTLTERYSMYELEATINDTNDLYLQDDTPYIDETYRGRFYLRPDSLTMASGDLLDILTGYDINSASPFDVQLRLENGVYQVNAYIQDGTSTWYNTGWANLYEGWNAIEIEWKASGELTLWVNDTQAGQVTGVAGTEMYLETVRLGTMGIETGTTGVLAMAAYKSLRYTYIGLDSALAIDPLFADSFESGDTSAWDAEATDSGDLVASILEERPGTYGLKATLNDTNELYVQDNTPSSGVVYRGRFYLRPDALTMASGDLLDLLTGLDATSAALFYVQLRFENGDYQVNAFMEDGASTIQSTGWVDIYGGWNGVEIEWKASGELTLWVNGMQVGQVTGVTATSLTLDAIRLGAMDIETGTTGVLTLDGYDSMHDTAIGLDANIALDPIFADSFESGDLSAWDFSSTDGGDLQAIALAERPGTYGLEASLNDMNALYVQDNTPNSESIYRGRFYLRPNGLTMANGDLLDVFTGLDVSAADAFYVQLRLESGVYQVNAFMQDGTSTWHNTGWVDIYAGWNGIEIQWKASGEMTLWLDDVQVGQVTGVTATSLTLDAVRLGAMGIETGTTGDLVLDAYDSHRGSPLGLDASIPIDPIFGDSFESADTTAWDTEATDSGDLAVVALADRPGTYGLEATINDANDLYVQDNTPDTDVVYHGRFYLRPGGLTMASGDLLDLLTGLDASVATVFYVQIRLESGAYQVNAFMEDGDSVWHNTGWVDVFGGWNAVEIEWKASGEMTLWVNGGQVGQVTGLTATTLTLDALRLGAMGIETGTTGDLYLDAYDSRRGSAIGLDPLIAIDPIFADDFESADTTAWDAEATDSGDLAVIALAERPGTYGLAAAINDTNELYVQDNSPVSDDIYRGRFYLRPDSLTMAAGDKADLLTGLDASLVSTFYVQMRLEGGVYQVNAFMEDGDSIIQNTGWVSIYEGWNAVEIEWQAAGELTLWVNGSQAGQVTGVTATSLTLDAVRLGAMGIEVGTTGDLYLDAYDSRRDTAIGLDPDIPITPSMSATYTYDGDGNQVKSVVNGVTTYYVGGLYEVQEDGADKTVRKYYGIGLQRVAVRTKVNAEESTVNWLLGDHLGSTSLVANADGTENSNIKYTAFGKVRSSTGTIPTDYLYTGQRQETELGLYYYVARWYDPEILHFVQADTIVPSAGSSQSFDRYAYVSNNPMNRIDPSGHRDCGEYCEGDMEQSGDMDETYYTYLLENVYNWNVSEDFSIEELDNMIAVAKDIKGYVNDITGGNGLGWMQENLGGIDIKRTPLGLGFGMGIPGTVYLPNWWNGNRKYHKYYFSHELGHIWDSNTGQFGFLGIEKGVADGLNTFIGGDIVGSMESRFLGGTGLRHIPPSFQFLSGVMKDNDGYPYGNNSTADYLAESFALNIYYSNENHVELEVTLWINAYISIQASNIP